ncbi:MULTISPECIES: hypothetical protein [Sphingobacterium]|uniref:DUF2116 family Zn-ribbon domain-containing protein n=1 Tax=Sphingobacterium athyrii TaxID=2152717 RepID=A0A363NMP7_9SPHI|nr:MULTISPECIES: hypothetical protein [Sphingobacterium]PUV21997.1 hypothetical protein DCO56_23975 [Sphingobacterium athyrii]QIH31857.1 hypothetical protein G6053_02585 [Sphingobacterium sp. DR205]
MEKVCLECGKNIRGRSDKRFCDDSCRNAYNNKLNSDQTNLIRNVNNILRKNRRILADVLEGEEKGMTKVLREKLKRLGFDFKFHTHTFVNNKGQVYNFIYEMGYLTLENEWILVVQKKPL